MSNNKIAVVTLLLAVVILLNLPLPASMRIKAGAHNTVAPFQNTMSAITHAVGKVFSSIRHPNHNLNDKKEMLTEIAELKLKLKENKLFEEENIALRKLINFKNRQKISLVLCEVISRHGANGWWRTITVNRGSEDGITKGSAVITTDGLIGRIYSVSKSTSSIKLITDYSCNISCVITRTKAFGIVQGKGIAISDNVPLDMLCPINPLGMDYISKNDSIKHNDLVITSGLGEIFPAGLIVGHVIKAELDRSGLYQRATIMPAANLSALHYIFVIKNKKEETKVPLPKLPSLPTMEGLF